MCTVVAQPRVMPGSWDIESLPEPLLVASVKKEGFPDAAWISDTRQAPHMQNEEHPLFPTTPYSRIETVLGRGEHWVGLGGVRAVLTGS